MEFESRIAKNCRNNFISGKYPTFRGNVQKLEFQKIKNFIFRKYMSYLKFADNPSEIHYQMYMGTGRN